MLLLLHLRIYISCNMQTCQATRKKTSTCTLTTECCTWKPKECKKMSQRDPISTARSAFGAKCIAHSACLRHAPPQSTQMSPMRTVCCASCWIRRKVRAKDSPSHRHAEAVHCPSGLEDTTTTAQQRHSSTQYL